MTLNNHAPAIVLISPKSKPDRPPAKQKRKGQPELTLSLFLGVRKGLKNFKKSADNVLTKYR
jgi:hypothetical protein